MSMWSDEPEVVQFLGEARAWAAHAERIVELGSYAMHDHDPRPLWPGAHYQGVDWRAGPGVDVIGIAHEPETIKRAGRGQADLVLSVSALEHDPYWKDTLRAMVALAKEDGVLAVTCAGPGWGEHELDCAPLGPGNVRDWYRNVSITEIVDRLQHEAIMAGNELQKISAYYLRRRCSPHWLRSCVLVRMVRMTRAYLEDR